MNSDTRNCTSRAHTWFTPGLHLLSSWLHRYAYQCWKALSKVLSLGGRVMDYFRKSFISYIFQEFDKVPMW